MVRTTHNSILTDCRAVVPPARKDEAFITRKISIRITHYAIPFTNNPPTTLSAACRGSALLLKTKSSKSPSLIFVASPLDSAEANGYRRNKTEATFRLIKGSAITLCGILLNTHETAVHSTY
ncbi:hypothetical protein B0I21_106230 [Sphingobacterium paludis]|uniref:Uncharacterized protein n=1 Tax=Sphingobacterium paludis TaxID=1476465 RepID=A0A4R7CWY8_9SPHI|nr:hypothetical protein B0I21_106230 [Sphingobacterium paludis]